MLPRPPHSPDLTYTNEDVINKTSPKMEKKRWNGTKMIGYLLIDITLMNEVNVDQKNWFLWIMIGTSCSIFKVIRWSIPLWAFMEILVGVSKNRLHIKLKKKMIHQPSIFIIQYYFWWIMMNQRTSTMKIS